MEIGLLSGFLELDIPEMKDKAIRTCFRDARRFLNDDEGICMFTKQLGVFRECTSIVARIAALASLTSRNSWPILSLTAALPVFNYLVDMIPWSTDETEPGNIDGIILLIPVWYDDEESVLQTKMHWLKQLARSTNSRPEIMIFGAKQWIVEYYKYMSTLITKLKEEGKLDSQREEDCTPFLQRHVLPLIHSGARALMYLTVAFQPDYFGMPISQLTFLESSVDEVFQSISHLRRSLSSQLIKDMFRIRNLFECINIKSKVSGPENPAPYKSDSRGMKLELRDVSFRYKKDSPPVLKDVSFTVEAGQMVSIVGYNGSGTVCPWKMLI